LREDVGEVVVVDDAADVGQVCPQIQPCNGPQSLADIGAVLLVAVVAFILHAIPESLHRRQRQM
jgi:hypothetical protein